MLMIALFCFANALCTTSEELCNSIFEGYVEPFKEVISSYTEDINKKIYCRQVEKSFTPILWAIKCLKKVKKDRKKELKHRLKIIKLLIEKKAEVNAKAHIFINELENPLARVKVEKILFPEKNEKEPSSPKEVLPPQKKLDSDSEDSDFLYLMRTIEFERLKYLNGVIEETPQATKEAIISNKDNEIEDGFCIL